MSFSRVQETVLEYFRQHDTGTVSEILYFIKEMPVKAANGEPFKKKKRFCVPDTRELIYVLKRMRAQNENGIWRL